MPEKNPVSEQCDFEASKIRKRAGILPQTRFDPFAFANSLGISVIEPEDIPGLPHESLDILRSIGADWSGLSFVLPSGRKVVILNPFHESTRKNITLMEEICHFLYKHDPSGIIPISESVEMSFLEYNRRDEKEAYWIGAAVLVPFKELKSLILKRKNLEEMALHFDVSPELIEFRLKVSNLLTIYKAEQNLRRLLGS